MIGTRICLGALLFLLGLKLAWSLTAARSDSALLLGVLGVVLPLLPALIAAAFRLRGFWVYAGFAPLWFFCHGTMELVAGNHVRFASAEVALSLLYFVGYWLRGKTIKAAKIAPPPNEALSAKAE